MSGVFLSELALPEPDRLLSVGSGTHAEQTARALVGVERMLAESRPDLVVVPGDVNSTLAAALAAVKLGIDVAHLESGLRSFDWTMPEEHNRRLTDHVSRLCLTSCEDANVNLAREGVDPDRIRLVGNTMIDSLLLSLEAAELLTPWDDLGVAAGDYALVTLHRPALVDDDRLLASTATALADLARTLPVVFPLHPRTAARLAAGGHDAELRRAGVHILGPTGYLEFIAFEKHAALVLTDSGGVQEETSALGVPCFTLRDATERPVTVELGTNTVIGVDPSAIRDLPALLPAAPRGIPIPLWDGRAGERAAAALHDFVAGREPAALS
jgi:UDP-N-acetylglucosamine 2-epimerase (non-hydrolysing)